MNEKELREIILDYIASHYTLSLATEGNGLPHAATVFYVNAGFKLYFLSSPSSRHGVNFSLNPRVSATIDEDYSCWRLIKGIQLEGRVKAVGGIWESGGIAMAFVKKFPDVADFFSFPERLGEEIFRKVEGASFYELTPSRIYFTNNEMGFGHRDELILSI